MWWHGRCGTAMALRMECGVCCLRSTEQQSYSNSSNSKCLWIYVLVYGSKVAKQANRYILSATYAEKSWSRSGMQKVCARKHSFKHIYMHTVHVKACYQQRMQQIFGVPVRRARRCFDIIRKVVYF